MKLSTVKLIAMFMVTIFISTGVQSETVDQKVTVTSDTYIRAESDRQFSLIAKWLEESIAFSISGIQHL